MPNSTEWKIYRGNYRAGVVVVLVGALVVAWSAGVLAAGLMDVTSGRPVPVMDVLAIIALMIAVLLGGLAAWGGVTLLAGRVAVGERGLTLSSWPSCLLSDSLRWEAVESWSVGFSEPGELTSRVVWFRVSGRRWPVAVYEAQTWEPGFDEFLEDVRAHVGHKAGRAGVSVGRGP